MFYTICISPGLYRKCQQFLSAYLPLLFNQIVLPSLKQANEGLALSCGKLSFENRHEHIDALLCKGIREVTCAAPT